jgi:chromosome segregation ATPase
MKTKAEIIADIEFLSAMLADTEIKHLNNRLDRMAHAIERKEKRIDRLQRRLEKLLREVS